MKRSLLLSLVCTLLASSASSVYAIGVANITKINTIINGINSGEFTGSDIVDEIQKLKLTKSDLNAPIINHPTNGLNIIAYRALQKDGYTLNSMQVVQDVLSGKLPTAPTFRTVATRTTAQKPVTVTGRYQPSEQKVIEFPKAFVIPPTLVANPEQLKGLELQVDALSKQLNEQQKSATPAEKKQIEEAKTVLKKVADDTANSTTAGAMVLVSGTIPLTPGQEQTLTVTELTDEDEKELATKVGELAKNQPSEENQKKLEQIKKDIEKKEQSAQTAGNKEKAGVFTKIKNIAITTFNIGAETLKSLNPFPTSLAVAPTPTPAPQTEAGEKAEKEKLAKLEQPYKELDDLLKIATNHNADQLKNLFTGRNLTSALQKIEEAKAAPSQAVFSSIEKNLDAIMGNIFNIIPIMDAVKKGNIIQITDDLNKHIDNKALMDPVIAFLNKFTVISRKDLSFANLQKYLALYCYTFDAYLDTLNAWAENYLGNPMWLENKTESVWNTRNINLYIGDRESNATRFTGELYNFMDKFGNFCGKANEKSVKELFIQGKLDVAEIIEKMVPSLNRAMYKSSSNKQDYKLHKKEYVALVQNNKFKVLDPKKEAVTPERPVATPQQQPAKIAEIPNQQYFEEQYKALDDYLKTATSYRINQLKNFFNGRNLIDTLNKIEDANKKTNSQFAPSDVVFGSIEKSLNTIMGNIFNVTVIVDFAIPGNLIRMTEDLTAREQDNESLLNDVKTFLTRFAAAVGKGKVLSLNNLKEYLAVACYTFDNYLFKLYGLAETAEERQDYPQQKKAWLENSTEKLWNTRNINLYIKDRVNNATQFSQAIDRFNTNFADFCGKVAGESVKNLFEQAKLDVAEILNKKYPNLDSTMYNIDVDKKHRKNYLKLMQDDRFKILNYQIT